MISDTDIVSLASSAVKDSIYKQMQCADEPIILLYDLNTKLSQVISDAYIHHLPSHAQCIEYDESKKDEIIALLRSLPSGANVFLVQSSNFRLDDFRLRLQLFNAGVGCLEHAMLQSVPEDAIETYLKAFLYRGEEYKQIGDFLGKHLSTAQKIQVFSGENSVLSFGTMEEVKVNDGRFFDQKNRGGGAICGEVFSESIDFSSVSGELSIIAYPDDTFAMRWCDPFTITIEKSFITSVSNNAPEMFKTNIIERVLAGENGEVMIREAGFGLNPALSKQTPLPYVNACERMVGFHVSVGKKHNIYRDKFPKDVIQRFHIDIFADTKKIICDNVVVFENGKYYVGVL